MVWAATWAGRRFCVCGELVTRFRAEAKVERALVITAKVDSNRPRLVTTSSEVRDRETNDLVAAGGGKYVPVPAERNRGFMQTLVANPMTDAAATILTSQS
jgi:acyl-coenzyme A thioesterase PaaI-like protein